MVFFFYTFQSSPPHICSHWQQFVIDQLLILRLKTSVADFIIESIYDLQGKVNDERVNSPIKNLRKRFDDVSSWTTYIVLSQLLPDERRAAFGCLLRVAISCWNIGNLIGAKEIITGLRWVNKFNHFCVFHMWSAGQKEDLREEGSGLRAGVSISLR